MKTINKCLLVIAILGAASAALAEDEMKMKKNCNEMVMMMHDTNKDGQLSK